MKKTLLFTSLCALACATFVYAGPTYKSGTIDGETWNSAGSPYLITGDLLINRLTIQPGVEVRFLSNYVAQVTGTLRAVGTVCSPIHFTTNSSVGWQGIYFNGSGSGSYLTHCKIEGSTNSGVRIYNSTPAFTNCSIVNNSSRGPGGGIAANVGSGTVIFQGCTISNNYSGNYPGGGGVCVQSGNVIARNTEVSRNTTPNFGGGVSVYTGGILTMINCKLQNNSSGVDAGGAGMTHGGASLYLVNCTLVQNTPQALRSTGTCQVTNSIVYFNNAAGQQIAGGVSVAYSDVQGGFAGTGNISDNPGLCGSNLSLYSDSACIDKGDPNVIYNDGCVTNTDCYPSGRGGARNDMGAYGGPGACNWPQPCTDLPTVTGPQSQTSCLGGSATFSVTAAGAQPFSYQWYCNTGRMDWQTGATLDLTNLQSSQTGPYWVVVSNIYGGTTSVVAQLVVNDACVDIHMYAGLNISGQVGQTYVLKYTTDLNNTDFATWTPLGTNTMTGSGWFYLDMDSPFSPRRFYGVKMLP